jgi:uncharacterized protein (DUF488 family)
MIFTIGYQKLTVERLVQIMDEKKIAVLVDVRSVPYSRKPDFNRKKLEKILGPRYAWLGDILGGKFGPAKPQGIDKLLELVPQFPVLVLCMEDNPCDCHRYWDIGIRLLDKGIDAVHIHGTKELRTSELLTSCDEGKLL